MTKRALAPVPQQPVGNAAFRKVAGASRSGSGGEPPPSLYGERQLRMGFRLPCLTAVLAGCLTCAQPLQPGGTAGIKWDFERTAEGWHATAEDCRLVEEPDVPGNHAFQIRAVAAHHTRMVLDNSEKSPDFLLRFRFRLVDWSGQPPAVYAYGRHSEGGFRALNIGQNGGRAFCYYGQDMPATTIGTLDTGLPEGGDWVHIGLACYGDYVLAKAWPSGRPEPGWQAQGSGAGHEAGTVALGVWTSPREASTATVLFDDVEFRPLSAEDLRAWRISVGPRPTLSAQDVQPALGTFEAGGRAGIVSRRLALAFDPDTGDISNLIDRRTGQEFIAADVHEPLFRLRLTKPYDGTHLTLSSRDFRDIAVTRSSRDSLQLRFTGAAYAVRVDVPVRLLDDDNVAMRINVTNESDWCVASVAFPHMPAPASLGKDSNEDVLLLPWSSGAVLRAPGSRHVGAREMMYPGPAFAQFYALYNGQAGLYVAMHDAEGHCKRFQLRCGAGRFVAMTLQHLFLETPGGDAALPYDIVLRTFDGDWRDAAAIYKRWAVQQAWCVRKLAERTDVPAFLTQGAGIIITPSNNPKYSPQVLGERLEKLPDLMDAYRTATGLKHMVFVPYGWENRGTWAGINYLPAFPSNELWRQANAELKKRGHRTAFLTSGFWWVVKRKQTGNGAAFDDTADFERRKAMCIANPDGTRWTADWYDRVQEFGSWRGLSAKLCHGSEQARNTMRDIFIEVARLGVPLVSFDQEIGGGQMTPCYDRTHGHPPGFGNWMWTGFRDVCAEILAQGKPLQPELGLFLENVSELAIPYMSTYWSRQFGEIDVGVAGGRGVGLFSYLYHEYVTAIGAACVQGQGQHGTRPNALLRCRILANNLVRGLIPGPFMHEVPLPEDGARSTGGEWRALVSRAYCSFCHPYKHFPEYLILGETCRPPQIECDQVSTFFWRRDAVHGEPRKKGGPPLAKQTLALPSVVAGSFKAADGSTGTVIVNTTPDQHDAVAVFPTGGSTIVYSAERRDLSRSDASRIALSLEPFGVRVLVIR